MLRTLTLLLCVLLTACASEVVPTGPSVLSGKQFTGNFIASDNRCNMSGCNAAVDFTFDATGSVTIRYLEDVQIMPGEALLRRGVAHQGTHPVSVQGNKVRFIKERHTYTLIFDGTCLKGQMRNTVFNFEFTVVACSTT